MKKNLIRKWVYLFFSYINLVIPKTKKILVYADPSLEGNSEALFRYLISNSDVRIVCATKSHIEYPQKGRYLFFTPTLLRVAFHMMTCSVLIDSSLHSVKMKPTKKQLFLQLWHGSPLKYLSPSKSISQGDYYSKICYAAEIFKDSLQKNEFNATPSKMLLAGGCHNDYLFHSSKKVDPEFGGKKIMWLPTYRHWGKVSHSRIDIPILNKENIADLNQFLREHNTKIYVKPHPLQSVSFEKIISKELQNVVLLSNSDLFRRNMTLYEFLADTDALLTDYSSVFFDYLLIDRPIGFTIDDYEDYLKYNGFTFDNPKELMPGMHLYNMDDLKKFVEDLNAGEDDYAKKREQVNTLANYYKDGNNCQRAYELIKTYI